MQKRKKDASGRFGTESECEFKLYQCCRERRKDTVSRNTFWHIKVPVPSIEEQRHISALISSIDNRIKIAEFEYKRLLQIRVGLMQQLFI